MYAALNGNSDVAKLLLRSGAKVNASGREGTNALLQAISANDTDMIGLSMNSGADPHQANQGRPDCISLGRCQLPSRARGVFRAVSTGEIRLIQNLFER